ncbi:MAG: endonuclease domain-containing protein [Vicinamibacteria bacterium]
MSAKERARDLRLRRCYGLTLAQYEQMFELGNRRCWVCLRPPKLGKNLNVDHDHKTERVRSLLCFACNKYLIGRHRDGAKFERAAEILKSTFDGRTL